jgi:hypothetical protein
VTPRALRGKLKKKKTNPDARVKPFRDATGALDSLICSEKAKPLQLAARSILFYQKSIESTDL